METMSKLSKDEIFSSRTDPTVEADYVDFGLLVAEVLRVGDVSILNDLDKDLFSKESIELAKEILDYESRHGFPPNAKHLEKKFEWFFLMEWPDSDPPPLSAILEQAEDNIIRSQEKRISQMLHNAINKKEPERVTKLLTRLNRLNEKSQRGSDVSWLMERDFHDIPEIDWVIDKIRPGGEVGIDFGPSETYKTFINLGMAMCISLGEDWGKWAVNNTGVTLYWAGEGGTGIHKRVNALAKHFGLEHPPSTFRLCVDPINLFAKPEDAKRFIKEGKRAEKETGLDVLFVVVDTLQKSARGLDENSGRDVGRYLESLEKIQRAFPKAYINIVTHVPKSNNNTPRGHSSQTNDLDNGIKYTGGNGKAVKLHCHKMKNDEKFKDFPVIAKRAFGSLVVLPDRDVAGKMNRTEYTQWILQTVYDATEDGINRQELLDMFLAETGCGISTFKRAMDKLVSEEKVKKEAGREGEINYLVTKEGVSFVRF